VGHPVRIVDSTGSPSETGGREPKNCHWTIYTSLEATLPRTTGGSACGSRRRSSRRGPLAAAADH